MTATYVRFVRANGNGIEAREMHIVPRVGDAVEVGGRMWRVTDVFWNLDGGGSTGRATVQLWPFEEAHPTFQTPT